MRSLRSLLTAAALALLASAPVLSGGCSGAGVSDAFFDAGTAPPYDATVGEAAAPDAPAPDATLLDATPPQDAAPDVAVDAGVCNLPADCPSPPGDCVSPICVAHACGAANVPAGTRCTTTGGKICSGRGTCVACLAPSDCAPPTTLCEKSTCSAANACGTSNAAAGAVCSDNGGKLCDGSGKCVACLAPSDCPAPSTVCKLAACDATTHACGSTNAAKGTPCTDNGGVVCDGSGTCTASHCSDGVKDGGETDVDCGGTCGSTCQDGKACRLGADCIDRVCNAVTKTCSPPSCSDGVQNGAETDVDCGGATCDAAGFKCADRKRCATNADCVNALCAGSGPGTCISCSDGVQDGNETDVDCGGVNCNALGLTCPNTKRCLVGQDCMTGYCGPGNVCAAKPNGQTCGAGAECASNNCVNSFCCNSACNGTCQACTNALTGQPDGTCSAMTAGLPAPTGQCVANPPCGNDGKCGAGGACEQAASSTPCASCAAGARATGTCSGAGACNLGAPAPCAGNFACASGTTCRTSCGSNDAAGDLGCAPSSANGGAGRYWCDGVGGGACQPTQAAGGTCNRNAQCVSGLCATGVCT